ncbi:MAG: hypothetical protein RI968_397 [Pseudomonadota bacterium]|jgi:hypothetical protein
MRAQAHFLRGSATDASESLAMVMSVHAFSSNRLFQAVLGSLLYREALDGI